MLSSVTVLQRIPKKDSRLKNSSHSPQYCFRRSIFIYLFLGILRDWKTGLISLIKLRVAHRKNAMVIIFCILDRSLEPTKASSKTQISQ